MSIERVKYIAEIRDLVSKPLRGIQDQATKTFNKADRELDQFQRNLDETPAHAGKAKRSLSSLGSGGRGSFAGLGGIVKGAIGPLAAFAGAAGLGLVGSRIVSLGAQMEQTRISFTTFLRGNKQAADGLINQLNQFANVTPFTNAKVIQASRTLLAFGMDANEILPTLKFLGDVSAGTGKDLSELGVIFGQIKGAGRLMGQDLLQLINAGFNPLQVISEKTGRSMADLKDDMSKGLISFDMVKQAFKDATSEGGLFFNLMQKQSQSLSGRWSTLVGKLEMIGITLGESAAGPLGNLVNLGIQVVEWFSNNLGNLGDVFRPLGEAMAPLWAGIREIGEALGFASGTGTFLSTVFNALGNMIRRISPVLQAMASVLGYVAGLIAKIISFTSKWLERNEWLVKGLKGIQGAIMGVLKNTFNAMKTTLGGLADVLVGMLTLDKDKISSGAQALKKAVIDGSIIGTTRSAVSGFREGYNDKSRNFFGAQKKETASADLPGRSTSGIPGLGGSGKTDLLNGLSEVKGDGRAAKNITINLSSLVDNINVYAEDPRDFQDQIRDRVTEALSLVLNDANIIAGQ